MGLTVAQKSTLLSSAAWGGVKRPRKATPLPSLEDVLAYCGETLGASYAGLFGRREKNPTLDLVASYGNQPLDVVAKRLARQAILHGRVVFMERRGSPMQQGAPNVLELVSLPVQTNSESMGALVLGFSSPNQAQRMCEQGGLAWLVSCLIALEMTCNKVKQALAQKEEQLVSSVLRGQEEERERLCLELHDSVAQTIASVYQLLQACLATPMGTPPETHSKVFRAAALTKQALGELREVINSVVPHILNELGLVETLRRELKQFQEDTGCRVQFDALSMVLPMEVAVALYRIVHEAVTNVRKHAQSDRLMVTIGERDGIITVRIKDWGVGFDPTPLDGASTGQTSGLFSMRKRAELLRGVCQVRTGPGHGTEVLVRIPFQRY